MKQVVLSLGIVLFMAVGAFAQNAAGAGIEFAKDVHDFGEMMQHGDASCEFSFTNTKASKNFGKMGI